MGVLVQPSARETFSPGELVAAYEDFVASGPRYLDAESGIEASSYRFGTRVLLVYEEAETGVTILIHPTPSAETTKDADRRRVGMVKNVSALDAYRGGELPLPPGYNIEHGADVLVLRREEGSVVAAFSARGATPEEVKRSAWDDHRQRSNTA